MCPLLKVPLLLIVPLVMEYLGCLHYNFVASHNIHPLIHNNCVICKLPAPSPLNQIHNVTRFLCDHIIQSPFHPTKIVISIVLASPKRLEGPLVISYLN